MEKSWSRRALGLGLVAAALGWMAACGTAKPKPPSREEVTGLLRQEAAAIKKGAEDLDPSLGVKAVWTITGVEVREQPQNESFPWAGAILFRARSETRDVESVSVDEKDRRYEYEWSLADKRWIPKL